MDNINSQQSLTASQLLLYTTSYNRQKLSLGVALWLCLLLGIFGAHRFYLRKNISGILYLLFSWSLIPGFLAIGDLFLLRYQIRRYNNLQAVELLNHLNPNSSAELIQLLQKNTPQWPQRIGQILVILAALLFSAEIYLAIYHELNPGEIFQRVKNHSLSEIWQRPVNSDSWTLPYYNISYDG